MLHNLIASHYATRIISTTMPTEREHDKHNPEIKTTNDPSFLLKFLDQAESYMYNFAIVPFTIRVVVLLLALYGLYKLIFSS